MDNQNALSENHVAPELLNGALQWIAVLFEGAGVAVMVLGLLLAVVHTGRQLAQGQTLGETYHPFRTTLARSILLGLEFLVAADIIGTVAVEPMPQYPQPDTRTGRPNRQQPTNRIVRYGPCPTRVHTPPSGGQRIG